jgi:hypothetical protein
LKLNGAGGSLSVNMRDSSHKRFTDQTSLQLLSDTYNFIAITIRPGKTMVQKDEISVYVANTMTRTSKDDDRLRFKLNRHVITNSKLGIKSKDVFSHLKLGHFRG